MSAWLAVIGIGEDGLAALAPAARALVESAELLVGGARHLAMVPPGQAERLAWRRPIADTMPAIEARRGARVVVLASGDPLCYGVGAMLARHFRREEMLILPQTSAFSLAAARLVWPLEECITLSLHGRALDALRLSLAPGLRVIALANDGETPAQVAALLRDAGFGSSVLSVFEYLAGSKERRIEATAGNWTAPRLADLNTLAFQCRAGPTARPLSRLAGLPDDVFEHDGQLTKRETRAATLATLAPLPGESLWDIGAGCGSVAIEWSRSGAGAAAIAIEQNAARATMIARNAAALGVPGLRIVQGTAPAALIELPAPDAVFLGGGISDGALWDAAWTALRPGGRLVANAVTLEGEAELMRRNLRYGGRLTRIAVSHVDAIGGYHAWHALRPVTQLAATKPGNAAAQEKL